MEDEDQEAGDEMVRVRIKPQIDEPVHAESEISPLCDRLGIRWSASRRIDRRVIVEEEEEEEGLGINWARRTGAIPCEIGGREWELRRKKGGVFGDETRGEEEVGVAFVVLCSFSSHGASKMLPHFIDFIVSFLGVLVHRR